MRLKTWQQNQFLTPRRRLYCSAGDFYSLDEFIPSVDGQRLERFDTFETHVTYPANFIEPRGAFYDQEYDLFVFVGAYDASPDLVGTFYVNHDDFTASSAYSSAGTPTDIGGTHKLNTRYIQNGWWFVGSDGDVYLASNPWGSAASNKYGDGDARAILPVRDTLYMITDTDEVFRYNTDSGTFVSLYDTWLQLGGTFLCHYRHSLLLLGYDNDGSLALYQIDELPPADIREIARLEPHTGQRKPDDAGAQWATPWALYHDELYFSPGAWISPDDAFESIPIYRYTGSSIELIDTVEGNVTPHAWGLVQWRDRLLLYLLDDGDQRIYLLHNDRFVQVLDAAYTLPSLSDLYSVGGHLALVTTDSGNDGVLLTRRPATTQTFTSSWLDMNHPASQKRLVRLAAIVSDAIQDFKVKIEYRTESGSWTQAVEEDNARHVDAGNLGVDFYMLQIRITFTEDISPRTYPDVTLESIAATYSYGVP